MAAGVSQTMSRCIEVCLQYLDLLRGKRRQVSTEPVLGVDATGSLLFEDASLRTSGQTTALQPGDVVPILHTRRSLTPGARAVRPAVALQHHAQKAQPPAPVVTLVGAIVEELFLAPISASDPRLDVWFRNDQQITRLNVRAEVTADPDLVLWGQRSNRFLVRIPGEVMPTYVVFDLNRPVANTALGASPARATFHHGSVLTNLLLHTMTVETGELIGTDLMPFSTGTTMTDLAPAVSVEAGSYTVTRSAVDDGTVEDVYLTEGGHVVVTVAYEVLIDFGRFCLFHWQRWLSSGTPPYYTLSARTAGTDATNDLLLNLAFCRHVALVDLTLGSVLWSTSGDSLTVSLAGTFRRFYHGGGADVVSSPILRSFCTEATDETGAGQVYNTGYKHPPSSSSDVPVDPPPSPFTVLGDFSGGALGLTAGISGALHDTSFLPAASLFQQTYSIRRSTMPPDLLNRESPGNALLDVNASRVFLSTLTVADSNHQVYALTGTATYSRVRVVRVTDLKILAWDVDPTRSRLFVAVKLPGLTDESGDAAAFIVDGTGALVRTLLTWTPYTNSSQGLFVGGGTRRHVLWRGTLPTFSKTVLTVIASGETFEFTSADVAQLVTVGATVLRPDFFYAIAEPARFFLTGWDYGTGAIRLDPANVIRPDARLAKQATLKNQPTPDPTVSASYQVVDDPRVMRPLGLPTDV